MERIFKCFVFKKICTPYRFIVIWWPSRSSFLLKAHHILLIWCSKTFVKEVFQLGLKEKNESLHHIKPGSGQHFSSLIQLYFVNWPSKLEQTSFIKNINITSCLTNLKFSASNSFSKALHPQNAATCSIYLKFQASFCSSTTADKLVGLWCIRSDHRKLADRGCKTVKN